MPILGNPLCNWNTPCLEQEYIRWYNIVQDNFIVHETKEAHKASYRRGWIGDQGTQYLMKYEWKKCEWVVQGYFMILVLWAGRTIVLPETSKKQYSLESMTIPSIGTLASSSCHISGMRCWLDHQNYN